MTDATNATPRYRTGSYHTGRTILDAIYEGDRLVGMFLLQKERDAALRVMNGEGAALARIKTLETALGMDLPSAEQVAAHIREANDSALDRRIKTLEALVSQATEMTCLISASIGHMRLVEAISLLGKLQDGLRGALSNRGIA